MDTTITTTKLGDLPSTAWAWAIEFGPRVLAATIILVAGFAVARWLARTLDTVMVRTHRVDATVRPFVTASAHYAIVVLVLILALGQLGFQTTSLLAVLGAAGLAIGLALQGTLSNIAAGIMLLWLRPFEVGDYIEVNTINGTVEETGLFSCVLRTYDGVRLFAPNSTLWNFALRNHSRTEGRMIALNVTLTEGSSPDEAAQALAASLAHDERILKHPEPVLFLESYNTAGSVLSCRFWTRPQDFGAVQRSIVSDLQRQFGHAGIAASGIALINRLVPAPTDMTRLVDFH